MTVPRQRLEARVLVVEDDADIRHMIATVLERAGSEVRLAASTKEAEAALEAEEFDAVLLDWHLGSSTGEAFLRGLETGRPRLFAHTAVVTGDLVGSRDEQDATHLGRPVLAKPFRPRELVETLASMLA